MNTARSLLPEPVNISIERMMRFCYLINMTLEFNKAPSKMLPVHLTRFGTLILEAASFLYSLFEKRTDSINLMRIWLEFENPFHSDLNDIVNRLEPFKDDLQLVRNRIGFHGSLNRSQEKAGLSIFDVESGRAGEFVDLLRDMKHLALRMIKWFCCDTEQIDKEGHMRAWKEFITELTGYEVSSKM